MRSCFLFLFLFATSLAAQTLPVERTLTDQKGRQLEVTILAAKETVVRAKRKIDGKEVLINVSTLSPADQDFVSNLPQGDPPPRLPDKSSISVSQTVEETGEIFDPSHPLPELKCIATPEFTRGRDMTDAPAFVRLISVQQDMDDPTPNPYVIAVPTVLGTPVPPAITHFPEQDRYPIILKWYAEVWQDGKILCKSYASNRRIESLPPPAPWEEVRALENARIAKAKAKTK